MKKNKIIIPAMAMILFSTAASISGTVAWFTANRVFQTEIGNFQVVEIDGSLDVTMEPGEGTSGIDEKKIKVIDDKNYNVGVKKVTKSSAEPASDNNEGDLWIDEGNANALKKYSGSAFVAATGLTDGDYYFEATEGRYYVADSATTISPIERNPAVLTHGSVDHTGGAGNEGKAYVLDGDSDLNHPDYFVRGEAATATPWKNWIQKSDVTLQDRSSKNHVADIYNAVSWTMKFKYKFAGDSAPIGVYLDLKKSAFSTDIVPTQSPDFTKGGTKGLTSKGFRIAFYDGGNNHDFVWGNNQYVTEAPTPYNDSGDADYSKGAIVRDATSGNIYKAKADITDAATTLDTTKWDLIGSLPTYSSEGKYDVGDKVLYSSKVYQCVEAVNGGAFADAKWYDLSGSAAADHNKVNAYSVGQMVTFDGKKYRCKTATTAGDEFDPTEWEYMSDNRLNATAKYDEGPSYVEGNIVQHDGHVYKCKASTSGTWDSTKWELSEETTDLRYVSSTNETTLYTKNDYVTTDHGYVRLDPLNANESVTWGEKSAPERVCTIVKDVGDEKEVTVRCAAWFEGTDPNVVTGAAMECLKANMVFYARTINND